MHWGFTKHPLPHPTHSCLGAKGVLHQQKDFKLQTAATVGLHSSQDFRQVINVSGKTRACYNRNVSLAYVLLAPDVIQQTFLTLNWLSDENDGLPGYQRDPASCLSSRAFMSLALFLQSGVKFSFLLHKTPRLPPVCCLKPAQHPRTPTFIPP